MKKITDLFHRFIKDESAQGATEYILLLVVVVGIAMLFRERIQGVVQSKIEDLSNQISSFSAQ